MGSIYSSCPLDFFGLALALLTLRSSNFLVLRFCVKRAMLLTLSAFVWALSVISFFFLLPFLRGGLVGFFGLNFPIMMQQNLERSDKVLRSCFVKSLSMS